MTSSGGEFTVWVDGEKVAQKSLLLGFPKEDDLVQKVKAQLGA